MSLKNFYQTFYQTEQLFRLDNDSFVAVAPALVAVTEVLLVDVEPAEIGPLLAPAPTTEASPAAITLVAETADDELVTALINGPVTEPQPEMEQPIILEAAPVKTMPSTHRPGAPTPPLLNHKVLILVDEELLPSDVLFLEKILNAINLNVNGVDLLNVHGLDGVDFAPILADKVIHHFLTFGVPFQRLNLDILMDRYQPVRFHGITFMIADPLAAIEGDKNLKKRLWEALKRIFLMS